MPTVSGTLQSTTNDTPIAGGIDVALCGYGPRVPRIAGRALVARLTSSQITVDPATGNFSFTVPGNDEISPAGTFYTVTVRDDNGDVAQVNAYQFESGTDYDLDVTEPFDPSAPTPTPPPPVGSLLLTMSWSATPIYTGNPYRSFHFPLQGDTTGGTLTSIIPGALYTFIITQDATGGHTFAWPTHAYNGTAVSPVPNSTTFQTFVAMEDGSLYAIAPGTYFM